MYISNFNLLYSSTSSPICLLPPMVVKFRLAKSRNILPPGSFAVFLLSLAKCRCILLARAHSVQTFQSLVNLRLYKIVKLGSQSCSIFTWVPKSLMICIYIYSLFLIFLIGFSVSMSVSFSYVCIIIFLLNITFLYFS